MANISNEFINEGQPYEVRMKWAKKRKHSYANVKKKKEE